LEKQGNGKTALITGGSRGIGRGIALVLASEGYDVAITYSTQKEEGEKVAKIIEEEYGRRCMVYQASMELEETPGRIVDQAVRDLGKLDVLVNNAGITIFQSIVEMDLQKMNFLINLNFKGYLLAMQAAARHMIERGIKGNIVNITSTRGERAYPRDSLYGGLKAGINRAVQSIALDLAPYGIRVNCIAPGATAVRDTEESKAFYESLGPRIPLGRMGTPMDIGHAVAWLVSDKASYITGQTIKVDGGLILPGMPEVKNGDTDNGWGFVWRRNKK